MPHHVHAKNTESGIRFREFSTVTDTYLTPEMTEEEMRNHLFKEWFPGVSEMTEPHQQLIDLRLDLAAKNGSSWEEDVRDLNGPWDKGESADPESDRNEVNAMVLEVRAGEHFDSALEKAIKMSGKYSFAVRFDFNGVKVTVYRDSDPDLIKRDWSRARSGYIKRVGPYPKPVLTEEELASDAVIKAENDCRYEEAQARYREKERIKREAVEARMVNAPEMEFRNWILWRSLKNANKDWYGGGIMIYAERWSRLMQLEMAQGKDLKDVAGATSYEADLEGMSGASQSMAASALVNCWKYGEQLRHALKD